MRSVVVRAGATLALSMLSVLLMACNGQGNGGEPQPGGSTNSAGDRLLLNLPDDFPLYPGLKIVDTLTLGDLYIIFEASAQGQREDVIDFYEEELAKGRWELVSLDSPPEEGTIFFSAPGFSENGRLAVSQDRSKDGRVIVAIALPIDALGGGEE